MGIFFRLQQHSLLQQSKLPDYCGRRSRTTAALARSDSGGEETLYENPDGIASYQPSNGVELSRIAATTLGADSMNFSPFSAPDKNSRQSQISPGPTSDLQQIGAEKVASPGANSAPIRTCLELCDAIFPDLHFVGCPRLASQHPGVQGNDPGICGSGRN